MSVQIIPTSDAQATDLRAWTVELTIAPPDGGKPFGGHARIGRPNGYKLSLVEDWELFAAGVADLLRRTGDV